MGYAIPGSPAQGMRHGQTSVAVSINPLAPLLTKAGQRHDEVDGELETNAGDIALGNQGVAGILRALLFGTTIVQLTPSSWTV
jgi:F420-0:gamma-glutamyl ligase